MMETCKTLIQQIIIISIITINKKKKQSIQDLNMIKFNLQRPKETIIGLVKSIVV